MGGAESGYRAVHITGGGQTLSTPSNTLLPEHSPTTAGLSSLLNHHASTDLNAVGTFRQAEEAPTSPTASARPQKGKNPLNYGMLAIAAAVVTLVIKFYAAWLTNSVGLFSDAMESIVNVVTSILLVVLLRIAQSPPDDDHPHGHDKAEYFANAVQGVLVLLAGAGIALAAVERYLSPVPLEDGWHGLSLSILAGAINLLSAQLLMKAGEQTRSAALKGEASHLMSDVWTSVAVLLGVGLVYLTGYQWLDPLTAAVLSVVVLHTGWQLLKQFVSGMMDSSVPPETQDKLESILEEFKTEQGIDYHALRTRVSGARTFVSVHILVPGDWSVHKGHDLIDRIEGDIQEQLTGSSVITHLEPLESKKSFQDIDL